MFYRTGAVSRMLILNIFDTGLITAMRITTRSIADAAGRIKTPYAAMIDNDDFLVVDALRESVLFLRDHSDYVACGGQTALFWVGSDRPDGDSLYGKRVEWKAHRGD